MEELGKILRWEATAPPVSPDPRAYDQGLLVKTTVGYIVAAVIWNEDEEVVLIQEAKASCRGTWYLPAGRVEPDESLLEAVRREVLEESGLEFEAEAVLAVEHNTSALWTRVTFVGKVTGGSLKTTAQADRESLQAGWFTSQALSAIPIRANDCLSLIKLGKEWYYSDKKPKGGLPPAVGHTCITRRLVLVHKSGEKLFVLLRTGASGTKTTKFPVARMGIEELQRAVKNTGYTGTYNKKGILSLEHLGKPPGEYDGMCMSVLMVAESMEMEGGKPYQWEPVEPSLAGLLEEALQHSVSLTEMWF